MLLVRVGSIHVGGIETFFSQKFYLKIGKIYSLCSFSRINKL